MGGTGAARNLVAGLVPAGVVVVEGPLEAGDADLWPEEAAAVAHAVAKRRDEFATGRRYARRALAALGIAPGPLPANDDRTTRWPHGVVGSITHSATYCAAAVARGTDFAAVGIDVEDVDRFGADVVELILTAKEIAALLVGVDAAEQRRRGAAVFSAKESLYKALAATARLDLTFHDADVALDDGAFRATLHRAVAPYAAGHLFTGRFAFAGTLLATALAVPR